jgi:hypothetical protein
MEAWANSKKRYLKKRSWVKSKMWERKDEAMRIHEEDFS